MTKPGNGKNHPVLQQPVRRAEKVFMLLADPITSEWVKKCNPTSASLEAFYKIGRDRQRTYEQMIAFVMESVLKGLQVCFVLYGHPGVFAFPSHELLRLAKCHKVPARMLPAVSSEDCLFADLGLDPGEDGCQSFESTDFILNNRVFDPCSLLILWQFGVIGEPSVPTRFRRDCVRALIEKLLKSYPREHSLIIYQASTYCFDAFTSLKCPLNELVNVEYLPIATLIIPRLSGRLPSPDIEKLLNW